jgi:tetratricopeptide (TPR) repeat protein
VAARRPSLPDGRLTNSALPEPAPRRYSAFISYNHRDRRRAAWLHRALETYRIPPRMRGRQGALGPLGDRLPPVFRDREELATSSDLARSVREALAQSGALIVICSPNGARSEWVNEEIRTFTALGRRDRISCLIVEGVPHAASTPGVDPALECLPPALFDDGAHEPLAADLRPGEDGPHLAKLKLLAGVLGVGFDELRQREQARRTQRLALAAVGLGVALVLMSGLAIFAVLSRNEAVRQRDIARQKTETAERTVDFVKSLFEVSDPSEARGQTITAREILDRGAQRIDRSLAGEPMVKAELGVTLGEVYSGLGLYRQGEALIRRTLALRGVGPETRARQFAALGDAQARQGDYAGAVSSYRRALRDAGADDELAARILAGVGEAKSALNDDAGADRAGRAALRLDLHTRGPRDPDVARDLEALADNDVGAARYASARARVERALDIRLEAQGPSHPKVAEDLNALGAVAYLQRDPAAAESFYRRAMAADEAVIGADHPDAATTMNNLARLMIERRDYAEAEPLLRRAVAIILRERDETFDDLAFEFDNLALARRGLGDEAGAEPLLEKALRAARLHHHRNLAPILVDMADIACDRHDVPRGQDLLREAAPIMARDYPDDPWRTAWASAIEGHCRLAAGDTRAALQTLTAASAAIRARWPANSLYGARAAELLARARAEASPHPQSERPNQQPPGSQG